ncbi:MAG: ribosome-associated translation inhibitor RaiA [Elusimicrobia bacterium]|nr:ribosome-associated translation inhibitor RaiA [Elusimicrobiota bacterium]
MQIHITARRLRLSRALKDYVEQKVGHVEKYFNHLVWAQVILSVEKRNHQAEIVVHASGQTLRAVGLGADLYAAVDIASDRIAAQIKKYKERLQGRHKAAIHAPLMMAKGASRGLSEIQFSVIKQVPLHSLSREEAVREMETLGYDFWMFLDRETHQVHVVYHRQDGTHGLLQSVKTT